MFKDVLNHMEGATHYASIGLVIFFLVFLAITVRTFMRSRKQIARWSALPLEDEQVDGRPDGQNSEAHS